MKKTLKSFVIAGVGAVLFFILSFIVQYYFSVWTTIKVVIALATLNGIIGFITTIGIIYMKSDSKKFSMEFFTLRLIVIFMAVLFLMLLSTLGNAMLHNLTTICFIVGIFLAMIWLLYLSIKVLIEEYKKYKEKQ